MNTSTFSDNQFNLFSSFIFQKLGIYFSPEKKDLLQAKLDKLLHFNNLESYQQYYEALQQSKANEELWLQFLDEITVHQSGFFRENNHFEFIRTQLRFIFETNERILKNNEIRVWSAGCSTGEEPYTLGMVLKEWLPSEINIRILATDVSNKTLALAQKGCYPNVIKKSMDPYYIQEYFQPVGDMYEIKPVIKDFVTFRLFNLIEPFPFNNAFDLIFCRNVMIYFNPEIQHNLVEKFHNVLATGGLLFIGHSESLLNKQFSFQYIQPTVYLKQGK